MNDYEWELFWTRLERLERSHAVTRWAFILVSAALILALLYLSGGSGP